MEKWTYAKLDNTKVGDKVIVKIFGKYRVHEVTRVTSRTINVKGFTAIGNEPYEDVFYYQSRFCGGYFRNNRGTPVYKAN